MAGTTLDLQTPEAQAVGARSSLYRALARGFRPPTEDFSDAVSAGEFAQEVQSAVSALGYQVDGVADLAGATQIGQDELESAYIALFDVGGEYGAPCFIYEGEHGGGRMKVLEEALRFYHYFGLRLDEDKRERPDHLATELEFMHALTFQEAAALVEGRSPEPYQKAQRDFLRFHLEEFTSQVASTIGGTAAPVYPALARCAESFCRQELARLKAAL